MKKFLIAIGVLVLSGAAIAVAMDQVTDNAKTYSWRYKMTVEVETPEGVKTGSAVRKVDVAIKPYPLDARHPYRSKIKVKGEAVVVDLEERGVVFGLVSPDSYRAELYKAFPIDGPSTPEGSEYYDRLPLGLKADLTEKNALWLVTFTDLNDPQSIKTVTSDNISDIFGQGIKLKNIILEITDQPVEWGMVKQYLKWFGEKRIGLGFADPKKPDPVNYLTSSSFKLGEPK